MRQIRVADPIPAHAKITDQSQLKLNSIFANQILLNRENQGSRKTVAKITARGESSE